MTYNIEDLCPECRGLAAAIEENKRVAKVSVANFRLQYSNPEDDWPDELPLDYRMDVK